MKYWLFLIFQLVLLRLGAQERFQDVVTTKDGSIYRGRLMEIYPDSILKIRGNDKNIHVLQMKDVKQVTQEEISYTDSYSRAQVRGDSSLRSKGYTCITEIMGLNLYTVKSERRTTFLLPGYSFAMIHGYQFNPHLSVGIGSGLEVGGIGLAIPVIADVRYSFLNRRVSPFANFSAGYEFVTGTTGERLSSFTRDKTNLGIMNAGFGVKFGAGSRCYMMTSMGYKLMTEFKNTTVHGFALKFGVVY